MLEKVRRLGRGEGRGERGEGGGRREERGGTRHARLAGWGCGGGWRTDRACLAACTITLPARPHCSPCSRSHAHPAVNQRKHCIVRCCHAAVGELQVAFRRMRAFFELLDKLGVDYWCAGFLLA